MKINRIIFWIACLCLISFPSLFAQKPCPFRAQGEAGLRKLKAIKTVQSSYPEGSLKYHVAGRVIVQILVDENGKVPEANVKEAPDKLTGDAVVQGSTQEFKSAADALSALDRMTECKCDTDVKAYRYFLSHPDESIPLLIDFTLKHKQRYSVGIKALSRFRDERVITFLLELADDELHSRHSAKTGDNSYNETHPYSSENLICYVIAVLGDYGDKRAIPIIRESMSRLNNQDAETDVEALCKLGMMSIPELYGWHSESAEAMTNIALSNVHTNPRFSVELFDWVINGFPKRLKLLKTCHVGKVMAFYNEQEYTLALRECEILKQNIEEDSPDQISFVIDHFSYSLDEMMQFLKNGRDRLYA